MKESDIMMIVAVFLTLFSVMVFAYGVGLLCSRVQEVLVLGFGVAIFIAALYFYLKGKCMAKKEMLNNLKK